MLELFLCFFKTDIYIWDIAAQIKDIMILSCTGMYGDCKIILIQGISNRFIPFIIWPKLPWRPCGINVDPSDQEWHGHA